MIRVQESHDPGWQRKQSRRHNVFLPDLRDMRQQQFSAPHLSTLARPQDSYAHHRQPYPGSDNPSFAETDGYTDSSQGLCIHRVSIAICLSMLGMWILLALELLADDLCADPAATGVMCSLTRSNVFKMFTIEFDGIG